MDDRTIDQPVDASLVHIPGTGILSDGNAFAIRLHVALNNTVDERATSSHLALYPNPTEGFVTFRSADPGQRDIVVMDPTGRPMYRSTARDGEIIDLRGQPKGLYVVRITDGNGTAVQRIVME